MARRCPAAGLRRGHAKRWPHAARVGGGWRVAVAPNPTCAALRPPPPPPQMRPPPPRRPLRCQQRRVRPHSAAPAGAAAADWRQRGGARAAAGSLCRRRSRDALGGAPHRAHSLHYPGQGGWCGWVSGPDGGPAGKSSTGEHWRADHADHADHCPGGLSPSPPSLPPARPLPSRRQASPLSSSPRASETAGPLWSWGGSCRRGGASWTGSTQARQSWWPARSLLG
jgi:hypothetical protein